MAIVDVYRELYPRLRFEYKFHCEKEPKKRAFVNKMHEVLKDRLGAECEPCCFDDITKLLKGTAKCSLHTKKVNVHVPPKTSTGISVRRLART